MRSVVRYIIVAFSALLLTPVQGWSADNTLALIPELFTNTVTVIDTSTREVTTTLDLPPGTFARSGALSPDASKYYVGGFFGGVLVPIDVPTLTVGEPIEGIDPNNTAISGLSFSPDGSRLYAGNITNADQLLIIDTATDSLLLAIDGACGAPREPAEVLAVQGAVYFSCVRYGSGATTSTIRRLDAATLLISDVVEIGIGALTFDIHPETERLFAINSVDGTLSVVDLVSETVIETLASGVDSATPSVLTAIGVAVSRDGDKLYIGDAGAERDGLVVLDIASGTPARIDTGGGVAALDLSDTGAVLYAVRAGSEQIAVVDTAVDAVTANITLPYVGGAIVWGDFLRNVDAFAPGSFAIRGTLANLDEGGQVILQNNGADNLTLDGNGTFTFSEAVLDGGTYNVTVLSAPPGETCLVNNGSGVVSGADVIDVEVNCNSGDDGGGPDVEEIGGQLVGLASGGSVTLQNNGGDDLILSANGRFTFATPIPDGASYSVTVASQPTAQTCVVSNGSGTADIDVDDIDVICTTNRYDLGGTLAGLAGSSVTLQNNGGDDLLLDVNGSFRFPARVREGDAYSVTVSIQPNEQTCSVANGSGVATADINDVAVTCETNSYLIGGTLSGLDSGESVTLQNNGGDDLTLTGNGAFGFATREFAGDPYAVTVLVPPPGKNCTVSNASGNVDGADIVDVTVACVAPPPDPAPDIETIGGIMSGLSAGNSVTLQNNGGDDLLLTGNGSFVFANGVADGDSYAVTIAVQPNGQQCAVSNGSGIATRDVSNVAVNCVTITWPIGGSVSGLTSGDNLVLQNNGGDDRMVSTNGGFTFATELTEGATYAVTVLTQPPGQTCSVDNGSGTALAAVSDVAVTCRSDLSADFSTARLDPDTTEVDNPIALRVIIRDTAGVRVSGVPVTVTVDNAADPDAVTILSSPTATDAQGGADFTLRSSTAQSVDFRVSFNPDFVVTATWTAPPAPPMPPTPIPTLPRAWMLLMALGLGLLAHAAKPGQQARRV